MEFKIVKLKIEDLNSDNSLFSCESLRELTTLNSSPLQTGKLESSKIDILWVYKDVNGYQRIVNPFCLNDNIRSNEENFSCIELLGYSFLDCLKFQLQTYDHELTAVEKIYYISWIFENFVNKEKISKEGLFKELYHILNLQAFNHRPEKLKKLTRLSKTILSYCHSKKFSLKQIQLISQLDEDILNYVLSINKLVPVSASIFIQWVQTINDCLVQYSWSMETFVDYMETEGFNTNKLTTISETKKEFTPPIDTSIFKDELKKLRYKTLYDYNKVIEDKVKDFTSSKDISIKWDERCETPGFSLTITAKSKQDFNDCLKTLNDPVSQKKIYSILESI